MSYSKDAERVLEAVRAGKQLVPITREQMNDLIRLLKTATDERGLPMCVETDVIADRSGTWFLMDMPIFYCKPNPT